MTLLVITFSLQFYFKIWSSSKFEVDIKEKSNILGFFQEICNFHVVLYRQKNNLSTSSPFLDRTPSSINMTSLESQKGIWFGLRLIWFEFIWEIRISILEKHYFMSINRNSARTAIRSLLLILRSQKGF